MYTWWGDVCIKIFILIYKFKSLQQPPKELGGGGDALLS